MYVLFPVSPSFVDAEQNMATRSKKAAAPAAVVEESLPQQRAIPKAAGKGKKDTGGGDEAGEHEAQRIELEALKKAYADLKKLVAEKDKKQAAASGTQEEDDLDHTAAEKSWKRFYNLYVSYFGIGNQHEPTYPNSRPLRLLKQTILLFFDPIRLCGGTEFTLLDNSNIAQLAAVAMHDQFGALINHCKPLVPPVTPMPLRDMPVGQAGSNAKAKNQFLASVQKARQALLSNAALLDDKVSVTIDLSVAIESLTIAMQALDLVAGLTVDDANIKDKSAIASAKKSATLWSAALGRFISVVSENRHNEVGTATFLRDQLLFMQTMTVPVDDMFNSETHVPTRNFVSAIRAASMLALHSQAPPHTQATKNMAKSTRPKSDQDEAVKRDDKKRDQSATVCKFFNSSGGCRDGNHCQFAHIQQARGSQSNHRSSYAQHHSQSGHYYSQREHQARESRARSHSPRRDSNEGGRSRERERERERDRDRTDTPRHSSQSQPPTGMENPPRSGAGGGQQQQQRS